MFSIIEVNFKNVNLVIYRLNIVQTVKKINKNINTTTTYYNYFNKTTQKLPLPFKKFEKQEKLTFNQLKAAACLLVNFKKHRRENNHVIRMITKHQFNLFVS